MAARRTPKRLQNVARQLSAGQLLVTLFEPWHRTVTVGAKDLATKLQDAMGNGISRLVGFVVRLFVLLTTAVLCVALGILGVLEVVGWLFLPLIIIYCVVRSVTG